MFCQQRLIQLQQELYALIVQEDDKIGLKIHDAQSRQNTAVTDLRNLISQNIGKTGKDLSQLQAALQALVIAAS
jgi:hypothetical protein